MAKLPHFSKFPVSGIRATVIFAFVSAYGGGGSRPSNYTHLVDPREISVNRLFARSVFIFCSFSLGKLLSKPSRENSPGNFFRETCSGNFFRKAPRKFLPGNFPGKFLPENSPEIYSGKLAREISSGKLAREISPGKLPGNFSRETCPGNFFRKTPGKFLPENSREISLGNSREISSGKLPGNFFRKIPGKFLDNSVERRLESSKASSDCDRWNTEPAGCGRQHVRVETWKV